MLGVGGSREVDVREGGEEVEKAGLKRKQIQSLLLSNLFSFFFSPWPRHAAYGILVPPSGIEPVPPAVEVHSLNHWISREVPSILFFK